MSTLSFVITNGLISYNNYNYHGKIEKALLIKLVEECVIGSMDRSFFVIRFRIIIYNALKTLKNIKKNIKNFILEFVYV